MDVGKNLKENVNKSYNFISNYEVGQNVGMQNFTNVEFEKICGFESKQSRGKLDYENSKFKEYDVKVADLILDTCDMTMDDGLFFINLVQYHLDGNLTPDQANKLDLVKSFQSMDVSKNIISLLNKANETHKAVRIDFDNNISMILKIDKAGNLMVEFIPGDIAVEAYLRQNVANLKTNFDKQGIKYSNITYRKMRNKKDQKDN